MFWTMFTNEMKMMISSRRFVYSMILLFFPVAVGVWYCHIMWLDPSVLSRMTGGWLTHVTPTVCTMVYMEVAPLPVALVAVIFASDFIAGEEERGTLLLLVSKPFSRSRIVLAKYFAFLLIFLVLVGLSMYIFSLSLGILGIDRLETIVLVSYTVGLFCIGIVYTSLAAFFSVVTIRTLTAILIGFILLVAWYIFDWMVGYLPYSVSLSLEKFSLSYYINKIIGYMSGGRANLLTAGGIPEVVSSPTFSFSLLVILGILTVLPLVSSVLILERKDI